MSGADHTFVQGRMQGMAPSTDLAAAAGARAEPRATWQPRLARRHLAGRIYQLVTGLFTLGAIAVLLFLLYEVASDGIAWLNWDFLNNFPSRIPSRAGIKSALWGSAWLTALTAAVAIPLGVGAAVYLEEFAADTKIRKIIDINIANLAGVPSIVYGMLGLAVFVRFLGFDRSVLSGALTMAILILPIIIVAAREALKAVPQSIRHAAFALGATRWQTIRAHVLPSALPGILTGVILSMSRAMGETAPLIMIGALNFVAFVPEGPMDSFTVLPIQIFNWASRPQDDFHSVAAAGIIVLLAVLLATNAIAIVIRYKFQGKTRW
jgi:phosphate transport system permease protein